MSDGRVLGDTCPAPTWRQGLVRPPVLGASPLLEPLPDAVVVKVEDQVTCGALSHSHVPPEPDLNLSLISGDSCLKFTLILTSHCYLMATSKGGSRLPGVLHLDVIEDGDCELSAAGEVLAAKVP